MKKAAWLLAAVWLMRRGGIGGLKASLRCDPGWCGFHV